MISSGAAKCIRPGEIEVFPPSGSVRGQSCGAHGRSRGTSRIVLRNGVGESEFPLSYLEQIALYRHGERAEIGLIANRILDSVTVAV